MAAQLLQGWRTVQSSSDMTFMIKSCFTEEKCNYQLDIFDGSKFWRETMLKDEFCKKCRDSNPKVEADCFYLFSQIQCKCEGLGRTENSKLDLSKDDTAFRIHLRIRLEGGIPFSWTFNLTEYPSPVLISKEMILPLLSMIGDLLQQREDLFNIIARKDNEIQDYKDQGAIASRKSLETSRFESSTYLEERPKTKNYVETLKNPMMIFSDTNCQELYRSVLEGQRGIGESKEPASLVNEPVEEKFEVFATQAVDSTVLQTSSLHDDQDQGEEMTRRNQIAGKLAGKASEDRAKKKRKKLNL